MQKIVMIGAVIVSLSILGFMLIQLTDESKFQKNFEDHCKSIIILSHDGAINLDEVLTLSNKQASIFIPLYDLTDNHIYFDNIEKDKLEIVIPGFDGMSEDLHQRLISELQEYNSQIRLEGISTSCYD